MTTRRTPFRGRRGRGISALEFALILPIFLLVLYGLITYALIFAAQHTLALAASESARAALQFQPAADQAAALALRRSRACATASQVVGWINALPGTGAGSPSVGCIATTSACSYAAGLQCLEVTLTYADYTARPLVPIPPLMQGLVPGSLQSSATVQLSPMSLTAAPVAPSVLSDAGIGPVPASPPDRGMEARPA